MDAMAVVEGFLAAAVRVATPLLLAATGETVAQRSGVMNLGLEGVMLTGALAAALGAAAWGPWTGAGSAVLAGMLLAGVFALVAIGARADQIIAGTAITLGAVGLTGTIYRQAFGAAGAGLDLPTLAPLRLPGLSKLPVIGAGASSASPRRRTSALLAVPVVWWFLFRTRAGLALRATGEAAAVARASGVRTSVVRAAATVAGGAFGGLAGATLVLAQVGTFAERMTAGRGYVAIAIVVLGRWHPVGVALGVAAVSGRPRRSSFCSRRWGSTCPISFS